MNDADALSAVESLFFRWQAHRAAGRPVAPPDLCRDRPELLARLERRIADEFPDSVAPTGEYGGPPPAFTLPAPPEPPTFTLPAAEAAPAPAPATATSGRYEVAAEHARGGMGRVCVAVDTELNRRVAFKDIQERFADDPGTRHRFTREALITGQLEHPGVIPVYGLGADPLGRPYYAMRFVEGASLRDAIKEFHRTPPKREPVGAKAVAFRALLKRFADVCNAVAFAHSKRIVHRDLKPDNVMLGTFGETLVVDWGLARSFADRSPEVPVARGEAPAGAGETADLASTAISGGDSAGTRTGQVMGSPAYMSPEQSKGDLRSLGPAWDIYSLGATLYELLTGRPPFVGRPLPELLKAIQAGELVPPREVAPWVPKPLDAVARKAMAREAADRYPAALELAAEIERYLADEPVIAHRDTPAERVRRWRKRHPVLVRTVASFFLVVTPLLAAGLLFVNGEREKAVTAKELETKALAGEKKAHDDTRDALDAKQRALAAEQAALAAEAAARRQVRATLDLTTDAVVGKILAKQSRLGPDEKAFLAGLIATQEEFAADAGATDEARLLAARARLRVAQIRERLGDAAGAAREYLAAAEVLRPLSPPGATDDGPTRDLGTALLGYATNQHHRDVRLWEGPLLEGLQIREAAHRADVQNPKRLYDTCAAMLLGAEMMSTSRPQMSENLYRQLISVYERIAGRRRLTADEADMLGNVYERLAQREEQKGRFGHAYKELDAVVQLFTDLEKRYADEPRYTHQRARARTTQVRLLIRDQKHDEAARVIAPLVKTRRELAREYPAVHEYRFELAVALSIQVGAFEALKMRAEELRALRDVRAVLSRLHAEYPELDRYRVTLINALRALQKKYTNDGRLDEAQEAKDEADALEKAAPR